MALLLFISQGVTVSGPPIVQFALIGYACCEVLDEVHSGEYFTENDSLVLLDAVTFHRWCSSEYHSIVD